VERRISNPSLMFDIILHRAKDVEETFGEWRDGVLHVKAPKSLSWEDAAREALALGRQAAAKRAQPTNDAMTRHAAALAVRFDLPAPTRVVFHVMKLRWGIANPETGEIRLAHALAAFPQWVRDYALVYFMARLRFAEETDEFWEHVRRYDLAERARGFLLAHEGPARWDSPSE
jgi:predicted metal-dependent hydrolase